jgi:hypothetical protein
MTDQDGGPNEVGKSADSGADAQGSKPVNAPNTQPASAADLAKVEKQMSDFERSMLKWTGGGFLYLSCHGWVHRSPMA